MNLNLNALSKDKPYLFFLGSAIFLVLIISFLFGVIIWEAYPVLSKTGILQFIFGTKWNYDEHQYGVWIFIVGTFAMTITTMCMAVPLGLFTAIYLAEFSHPKLEGVLKTSIELLVGIPSVVYGIFGAFILQHFLKSNFNPIIDSTLGQISPVFKDVSGEGEGIFLAAVILTVMIIPTIISISENALRSVSRNYKEASYSLGATRWETIQKVTIPTAMPGILAGITLGMTRALGETMAIAMLLGNKEQIPTTVFDSGYAMTTKILSDLPYYMGDTEAQSALFGIAALLFVVEAILILAVRLIGKGGAQNA